MAEDADDKRLEYDGERGPAWRAFRRDLLAKARGKFTKDDRYSFASVYLKMDEGGTAAGAPAMPAAAAALAQAQQKQIKRRGEAFTWLYDMIKNDSLKDMLSDIDDAHADGIAGAAFDLLVSECEDPQDELEISRMNVLWTHTTILNSVGHSPSTITDYHRHITSMNSKRPVAARYAENDMCIKFLSSIVYPDTLAAAAAKELRANGAQREYVHPGTTNRSLNAMKKAFDDIWRSLYQTMPIGFKAPAAAAPRVNALVIDNDQEDEPEIEPALMHTMVPAESSEAEDLYVVEFEDGEEALFVGKRRNVPKFNSAGSSAVKTERVCRRCWGFGHQKEKCPSTDTERNLTEVIEVLNRINRAMSNTGNRPTDRSAAGRSNQLDGAFGTRGRPFRRLPSRQISGARVTTEIEEGNTEEGAQVALAGNAGMGIDIESMYTAGADFYLSPDAPWASLMTEVANAKGEASMIDFCNKLAKCATYADWEWCDVELEENEPDTPVLEENSVMMVEAVEIPHKHASKVWLVIVDEPSRVPHLLCWELRGTTQLYTIGGKREEGENDAECMLREMAQEIDMPAQWELQVRAAVAESPTGAREFEMIAPDTGDAYDMHVWMVEVRPLNNEDQWWAPPLLADGKREAQPGSLAWRPATDVISNLNGFDFARSHAMAIESMISAMVNAPEHIAYIGVDVADAYAQGSQNEVLMAFCQATEGDECAGWRWQQGCYPGCSHVVNTNNDPSCTLRDEEIYHINHDGAHSYPDGYAAHAEGVGEQWMWRMTTLKYPLRRSSHSAAAAHELPEQRICTYCEHPQLDCLCLWRIHNCKQAVRSSNAADQFDDSSVMIDVYEHPIFEGVNHRFGYLYGQVDEVMLNRAEDVFDQVSAYGFIIARRDRRAAHVIQIAWAVFLTRRKTAERDAMVSHADAERKRIRTRERERERKKRRQREIEYANVHGMPLDGGLIVLNETCGDALLHGVKHESKLSKKIFNSASFQAAYGEWIVDSGATKHVTPHESDLLSVQAVDPKVHIRVGDGKTYPVRAIGTALITVSDENGGMANMLLTNVLVVPECKMRLFSTKHAFRADNIKTHLNDVCELEITTSGARVSFSEHGQHYSFKGVTNWAKVNSAMAASASTSSAADDELQHKRMAHFSSHRTGVHDPNCESCALNARKPSVKRLSKMQRGAGKRFTYFGQRVSSDLMKMPKSIPHEFEYVMVFVDAWSFHVAIRFLKSNTPEEVLAALKSYCEEWGSYMKNGTVDEWHTDNGGEFDSPDLHSFCYEMSTRHTTIVPETPQDNGQAERMNGVLLRGTRIGLADANLTDGLWPFAMSHIAQVHNSLPTRAHDPPVAPTELVTQRPANLERLKVWGCEAFVPLPEERRKDLGASLPKTSAVNLKAINLGYSVLKQAYNVYIPELARFTQAHVSKFIETKFGTAPELVRNETVLYKQKPDVRRARHAEIFVASADPWEPKTFAEAVDESNPYREKWIEAMTEDIEGKMQNGPKGAWTLVDQQQVASEGRRTMKGKWTYKLKWKDNRISRFKARWVACGYSQIEGVDFTETFSSTLKGTTIRIALAEMASRDLEMNSIDVVKAFTHSVMDQKLYVEQPHGFAIPGKVCLLNQSLEGTKQAAHLWQKMLSEFLVDKEGMERSSTDPCLYTKFDGDDEMILIVWVDDLIMGTTTQKMFDSFYERFSKVFSATKSDVDMFVGIELSRDRKNKKIKLTQTRYIEKIFDRFLSNSNSKAWKTPSGTSREDASRFENLSAPTSDEESGKMNGNDYLALMGALLYAACMTRIDVLYHVSHLCRLMATPSKDAYDAGLAVLSYLNSTKDIGLNYGGPAMPCADPDVDTSDRLIVIADSSFGKTAYPHGGGFVQWRNAAVSGVSRKPKFAPQSTWEAELAVMVLMIKEAIFAENILVYDLKVKLGTTHVLTDSKAAYDSVRSPGATKKSTHVERWLMFARDLYLMKKITVGLVSTLKMMADNMTKVVDKTKFFACRNYQMNIAP